MRDAMRGIPRLLAVGVAFCATFAARGEAPPNDEDAVRELWSQYYSQQLSRYRFALESNPAAEQSAR